MYRALRLPEATFDQLPIDSLLPAFPLNQVHGGLLGFQSQLPVYVDPARWLERWRPTLENPYTSYLPMLTTGGIPVITPEPVALSCVTSQCARSSGLLVRSYCSGGGLSATPELPLPCPRRGLAMALTGQGIRGVVIVVQELVSLSRQ